MEFWKGFPFFLYLWWLYFYIIIFLSTDGGALEAGWLGTCSGALEHWDLI